MLLKSYLVFGCVVLATVAGLAATNVRVPRGTPSPSGYSSGPSYHSYSSGGWGFGK